MFKTNKKPKIIDEEYFGLISDVSIRLSLYESSSLEERIQKIQDRGETGQDFCVRSDGFEAELAKIRQRQANIQEATFMNHRPEFEQRVEITNNRRCRFDTIKALSID